MRAASGGAAEGGRCLRVGVESASLRPPVERSSLVWAAIRKTLGVSFAWVKRGESLDLSTFVPENEEFVDIPSLELDEGASQHFNIAIDQEIPERRDGHFQPVVRVVEDEHRGDHSDPVKAE